MQRIPDIINVRGITIDVFTIEHSYIRVLRGMKLTVGAKIRIDYKLAFRSLLYPGSTVVENKPGPAQVGAISKAQK